MSEFATPPEGPSAGALLRAAREAAGLHLESLAIALKVPPRKLEALEQDRYDLLPDLTFARALASSVCRALKIDPQPVLERLPQSARPKLAQVSEGINTPFREPGAGSRAGWLDQLTRPVALTVVALLLAAVVIIFLPTVSRETASGSGAPQPEATVSTTVVPSGAESSAAATPAVVAAPVVPSASTSTLVVTAPVALPAVPASRASAASRAASAASAPAARASAPAPADSVAAVPATTASAPAAAASATTGDLVTFRTRAASWVQVTDANGKAVLRRLMQPGETATAGGVPPLSVTVGSAEATEVQVRGKPFNLGPVSRDNVARFEVK